MGNRTKQINLIKEKKNQIVTAYCALGKNNSSCFDFLANSYPDGSISKIFATYGNIKNHDFKNDEDMSICFAEKIVKNLYGKKYIPMELYSANFAKVGDEYRQQKYICIANKDRVDRKRKFEHSNLMKYIDSKDVILLNVKERKIGQNLTENLVLKDESEYKDNALELVLKSMPTLSTIGKSQNSVVMNQLKHDNFKLFEEVIKFDKKIAQSMFLYETAKEQLLYNEAIEEFQSEMWNIPVEQIKENIKDVDMIRLKAETIGNLMSKNSEILKNVDGLSC